MAPAFEQAAAELEPDFRFLKVDADEEQQLMAKFGIRSIPTTMLFSHGSVVAQPAGAMSAGGIAAWVKSHSVPSPTAEITGRSFALSADSQHDLAEHVALREAGVGFGGVPMQHHADHRPAWALLAVRRALIGPRNQARAMQMQLGPL
jgi:thiol-disulfide isomerase/thioredoxin